MLEEIPHFATVSYAFCKRFPPELGEEIFAHILNKALNNRMVDPSMIFIDGTHIKASANKKKFRKEQVARAAKVYEEQLRKEVSEERKKLGKKVNDVFVSFIAISFKGSPVTLLIIGTVLEARGFTSIT